MGAKKYSVHRYFNKYGTTQMICSFCGWKTAINATRMNAHIKKCIKCPQEIKKIVFKCGQKNVIEADTTSINDCSSPPPSSSISSEVILTKSSSSTSSRDSQKTTSQSVSVNKISSFMDTMSEKQTVSSNLILISININKLYCFVYIG